LKIELPIAEFDCLKIIIVGPTFNWLDLPIGMWSTWKLI